MVVSSIRQQQMGWCGVGSGGPSLCSCSSVVMDTMKANSCFPGRTRRTEPRWSRQQAGWPACPCQVTQSPHQVTPLSGAFFFGRRAAKCIVPALNNGFGQATAPSWVRLGALLCSPPIFLITTSQLLSRDGRLIRATVLLANGRARGCCASALLRREEEGFHRLRSKTSLLVAVFSDFRGDKGTKSCQFIRRKFPNLWSHIYSSIFDIFDMHNSCVLAVV